VVESVVGEGGGLVLAVDDAETITEGIDFNTNALYDLSAFSDWDRTIVR